jgi:hypothetical protein
MDMIDSEREKLFAYESEYLSIGITKDGQPRTSGFVPWESMGCAFNMKTPKIFFTREDFDDPVIMDKLKKLHILGCYIFTPLEDYGFLSQFTEIWDMHIEYGSAVQDLSFMRHMDDWFMLYIEDAHLKDLKDIFPENKKEYRLSSRCMGFYHCQVEDISAMLGKKIFLAELMIWSKENNPEEKAKWKQAGATRYRYYITKQEQ